MILMFATVARNRRRAARPFVSGAFFVTGYLLIWALFSLVAALAQWLLHREPLLSPTMASSSAPRAGVILLVAGVFQFTRLKRSRLTHCRAPLEFITTRWRDTRRGAIRMGLEHGAFCTGCRWALMALLFVLGVMNIVWIAALTVIVALEKMLPRTAWLRATSGVALLGWGGWVLILAFR